MRHAASLDAELSQNFPRMETVGPLAVEAISAVNLRRSTPAMLLEDTGLVRQFVNAPHICRSSRKVDSDAWDDVGDRVLDFLRNIWARFE